MFVLEGCATNARPRLIAKRAIIGALAEQIRFSIRGKSVAAGNRTAARTAQDTDIAAEMSSFKRNQLLMLVNLPMLP